MHEQNDFYDPQHQEVLDQTGFWGRKGAGCIIVADSTKKILIPKRSALVLEPNTWGVFGGAIDPDENERQAVVREIKEETGKDIDPENLEVLYVYKDIESGFKYTTYVTVVPNEFIPVLNWESAGAVWFEFGNWPSPLHYGLEEILKSQRAYETLRGICTS